MIARLGSAFALLCGLLCHGAPALAQSTTHRFNRYIHDASEAYQRGDAEGAVAALQHAYDLNPVPLILFNIGRAYELEGRIDAALEYYDRFLNTNPPADQAQTARDARDAARRTLEERARASSSPPPPSSSPPPAPPPAPVETGRHLGVVHIALLGGGAVSLITGVIFGVLALNESSEFAGSFDPTFRTRYQSNGNTYAWGSDIGLGVGVLAIAAGVLLYLMQPSGRPHPATASASPHP